MTTGTRDNTLRRLELPDAFEDMTGLIGIDLTAITSALAERAGDRLLLSPRQTHHLRCELWNNLTQVINETMEPLTVERH